MHKRYVGWSMLILMALAITVYAKPIAGGLYGDGSLAAFRASKDYALHMEGLRTTQIKIDRQKRRKEEYRRKLIKIRERLAEIRRGLAAQ
jgi:hypothetical protein